MDPIKNSEFIGKNICNIFIKPNVVQNQKQVYFVDTSLIVIRIPDAINQKKKRVQQNYLKLYCFQNKAVARTSEITNNHASTKKSFF